MPLLGERSALGDVDVSAIVNAAVTAASAAFNAYQSYNASRNQDKIADAQVAILQQQLASLRAAQASGTSGTAQAQSVLATAQGLQNQISATTGLSGGSLTAVELGLGALIVWVLVGGRRRNPRRARRGR